MINEGTVLWKTKIPKKLYNKVQYCINQHGISRDYFLNSGVDRLTVKNLYYVDFPDPQYLYRFSDEEEANLTTWQVRIDEGEAAAYNDFMVRYGYSGRDVLAAALYFEKGN